MRYEICRRKLAQNAVTSQTFLTSCAAEGMKYTERPPPVELAGLIECLWVVSDRARRPPRPAERILPDGCPEWIIHAGDPFERRVGERWVRQPSSFLAGTLSRPWQVRGGRRVATLGIRFKPGGAATLLRIDLTGTADREVDLARRAGKVVAHLPAAVRRASVPAKMLAAARAELQALVADRVLTVPATRRAVERIVASRGRVRVEALARGVHMSRRTLERAFQRELGISPK